MSLTVENQGYCISLTEELTGSNDITLKKEYGARFVIPCRGVKAVSSESVLSFTDSWSSARWEFPYIVHMFCKSFRARHTRRLLVKSTSLLIVETRAIGLGTTAVVIIG